MPAPSIVIEARLDSVWTDITGDVLDGLRWQRGISGSGPTDKTGRPGFMALALDNSAGNSAGLQGYYTPGHANQRAGWMHGTKMRLRIIAGAETAPWFGPSFGGGFGTGRVISQYVFAGKVRRIVPTPGTTGEQRVEVYVEDYLAEMQDFDEMQLALVESAGFADGLDDVLAEMPERPANEWIDAGSETWPFLFDDLDASVNALGVADDLALSEGGYVYLRGDETDGETFRGENRTSRTVTPVRDTFTAQDLMALEVPSSTERVFNDGRVTYTPRAVGASAEVLVSADAAIEVAAGGSVTIWFDYTDPNQRAARVGAKDGIQPVANTDFTANTAEGGGGTDITADFTVTASFFAYAVKLVIDNANASTGWLRGPGSADGAQVRATALRTFSPVRLPGENSSSVATFDRQKFAVDMAYNSSAAAAQAVLDLALDTYSGLGNVPTRVRVRTEKSDTLRRALPLDIGDRIALTEDLTAVNGVEVVIHGVTGEISNGVTRIEWDLAPALVSAPLIWNDPDAGKWDERAWGHG